jgi:hypothetical protein
VPSVLGLSSGQPTMILFIGTGQLQRFRLDADG